MKQGILKRLENIEKRMIPKDVDAIVFIEEGKEPGTYTVLEHVYHGGERNMKDTSRAWELKAGSASEAASMYEPPEGCKEPIVFIYDFGE